MVYFDKPLPHLACSHVNGMGSEVDLQPIITQWEVAHDMTNLISVISIKFCLFLKFTLLSVEIPVTWEPESKGRAWS